MLFMTVYTYEPGQRDEIIRRRLEKGALVPKGLKIVGEWSCMGSGRVFRLVEGDDPLALVEATQAWTDLGRLEVHPVVEVEKILPRLSEMALTAAR